MEEGMEMSGAEAAFELMELARGKVSPRQVRALQAAVRALVKRHFDKKKNKAKHAENGKTETEEIQ